MKFCDAFELALGGHIVKNDSSNTGYFRVLIHFNAELDVVLRHHFENRMYLKEPQK